MARYSAAVRTTNAPTSTLPGCSIYTAGGTVTAKVREVWVFNTTATACNVQLQRITTAGTQGAAVTEAKYDNDTAASVTQAFNSHTSTGPTLAEIVATGDLGAAIGSFVVWTFDDEPVRIEKSSNTIGIGITCTGTGQVVDVLYVWEE